MFPQAAKRMRLFHGTLPAYVRHVMLKQAAGKSIIHHDASHNFTDTVMDFASLFYVRDKVHSIIAQDTHLRGAAKYMNFVDMAIFAVFGTDLTYYSIGTAYDPSETHMVNPNIYEGNYFVPGTYEGMVIPISMNEFRYPHPSHPMDDFLPPE